MLVGLGSVPLALPYFGPVEYGLLAIVWSVLTYLGLINFGLPIALRAYLAATIDRNARFGIYRTIFMTIGLVCICFIVILIEFGVSWLLPLIGGIDNELMATAISVVFISFIMYLLAAPFLTYVEGFAGIGEVQKAKAYEIGSLLLGFLALVAIVQFEKGLSEFFFLRGLITLLVAIFATVHFCVRLSKIKNPDQTIRGDQQPRLFDRDIFSILKTGAIHFSTGIATMIVWHLDNLVISHLFGLEAVSQYSITFRLITAGFLLFTAINIIVGPIYGNLHGTSNNQSLTTLFETVITTAPMLGGAVWLAAVCFVPEIVHLWAGSDGYAGIEVVLALGAYGYCLAFVHANMALASALNTIKLLPYIAFLEAALNLGLSIFFARLIGLSGIAAGTFVATMLSTLWLVPKMISRQSDYKFTFHNSQISKHFVMCLLPLLTLGLVLRTIDFNFFLKTLAFLMVFLCYLVVSYVMIPAAAKTVMRNFFDNSRRERK